MIEAVLFDLDGVLVDACEWHYEALNYALVISGHDAISRHDHETKFNGLPTRVKLKMLNIPEDEINKINNLKQKITIDIINNTAIPMEEKIKLHSHLKSNNIKIGCVTNSIRETTELMLRKTGQLQFMDVIITNEDVKKNKPHPDCYNLAIQKLNTNPKNVLCVEDSEKGIQAATSSIAGHLFVVKNTHDVDIHNMMKAMRI